MDFNEAAVFVRVVQAGSFSAAARQLGLPTSTVSTRVARLERRLGVTLLQRTTRRLHLTEAGSLYFEHASTGLGYLMEAEAALDEARQQPQGTLKMTAPADLGDALLGHLLAETQARYPALSLELWLTERYVDLVAEGVDVAIRMGELRDSSLIAKSLGTIQWALFASPAYLQQAAPINSPVELAQHPCVQFTPMGRHHWELQRGTNEIRVPLPGQVLVNNIGVVKTMAESGQGVALLPTFICQAAVRQGGLQRLLPEWRGQADAVHLVYPKQRFMPPKLRGFIDLAVTALKPLFVA
ncbi:LysR family transcriptional regulator [Methylophilus sp. YYY-1]|uniref:LysR family transcriptional regulator n=1 Tax=Methylophilus sp. YYY-1 TaxID=2682087 RepID=UPI0023B331BC|nr:LysR family transcriptional regulator [Methylophilus sp. YYY-1]MDF0378989.1 LysR family transcriptional regulator [Methylophilus sp. YYY-1]